MPPPRRPRKHSIRPRCKEFTRFSEHAWSARSERRTYRSRITTWQTMETPTDLGRRPGLVRGGTGEETSQESKVENQHSRRAPVYPCIRAVEHSTRVLCFLEDVGLVVGQRGGRKALCPLLSVYGCRGLSMCAGGQKTKFRLVSHCPIHVSHPLAPVRALGVVLLPVPT